MPNNTLELSATLDNSGAITGLRAIATETGKVITKFSELGDSRALEQVHEKITTHLAEPMRKVGDVAETSFRIVKNGAETAIVVFGAISAAVALTTKAVGEHTAATEGLLNTYRAARIILSPTLFTGITLGAGIALEATVKLINAQGKLIEQQSLIAAQSKNTSFEQVQALTFAGKQSNVDVKALMSAYEELAGNISESKVTDALDRLGVSFTNATGTAKSSEEVFRDIGAAMAKIPDPVERARLAVALFGSEAAGKILPELNGRLSENLQRFEDWSLRLDGPTRSAVVHLRDEVKLLGDSFLGLADPVQAFLDKLEQGLVVQIALLQQATELEAKRNREQGRTPSNFGGENLTPAAPEVPSEAEIRRQFEAAVGAKSGQLFGPQNSPADIFGSAARTAATSYANSIEGVRAKIQDLEKQQHLYNQAITAGGPLAASVATALSGVTTEVERQRAVLKDLELVEAHRLEMAEKMRQLNAEGQGFYVLGQGRSSSIVTAQDIATTNPTRSIPSFFRSGNPATTRQGMISAERDLPEGLDVNTGAFISPSSSRPTPEYDTERQQAFGAGLLARDRQAADFRLASLRLESDATERLIELRTGPNGELRAAYQIADVRQQAIEKEMALTGDVNRYREDSLRNEIELRLRIAEIERQRMESIRGTTQDLLHTLFTEPSNFGSRFATTIRDAALKPIETGLANIATQKLYPAIFGGDGAGGINGLLGGIFGKQSNPLQVATDANTAATLANTAALQGFTLGTAGGGLFGGGNLGGGVFSFGGLTDQLGLPVAGIPSIGPLISQRSAGGFTGLTGLPGIAGLLGIRDRSVNIPGLPTNTLSNLIGTGIQIAGGTGELISGLSQGGARGDLTAAGGAAATAGGLLALLGGSMALAGPIGAAIGVALPLITSLFPDHKKARSEAIDTELQNARYTAATPQTYTMDVAGSAIDYSYSGQARTTVINNYNVSTMDASSFSDWLHGKGPVVASVVTQQLNTHGPLQNGIRSTVNPN